jgi:hypothetical protein
MQQSSGVLNAIHELEKEAKKLHEAISLLKRFQAQRAGIASAINARPQKRLSPAARRRISEAAKKRWAALRNAKATAAKKKI